MAEATKAKRRSNRPSQRRDAGSTPNYAVRYAEFVDLANSKELPEKRACKGDTILPENRKKRKVDFPILFKNVY